MLGGNCRGNAGEAEIEFYQIATLHFTASGVVFDHDDADERSTDRRMRGGRVKYQQI